MKEELAATGTVPSDKTIVVQRVPDELGDLRICVLTPFGSRIHAPWAMATLRKLRDARAGDIEAVSTDDGIVFRVPGGEEPLPVELLFPSPDEIEDAVTRELGGSSMFAARFREAAARALLLPRNHIGKRTPLWAQRKRAADLLAVAQQYPSFPIVLETYRECLRDAFDLPALVDVLRAVESRKIRVTTVDLTTPSPMAASLLFSFVGNFIYDEDAPAAERPRPGPHHRSRAAPRAARRDRAPQAARRRRGPRARPAASSVSIARCAMPTLSTISCSGSATLGDDEIRRRTDPALVTDGKPAASPATVTGWIESLLRDRRIVRVRIAGEERYVAVEDVARYRDALGVVLERGLPEAFTGPTKDALTSLAARYARTHGPFTAGEIAARWGLGEASVSAALDRLVGAGKVVTGTFLPSSSAARARGRTSGAPLEYCDAEVLQALKRKTLARLRKAIEPVAPETFARFLGRLAGHHRAGRRACRARRRVADGGLAPRDRSARRLPHPGLGARVRGASRARARLSHAPARSAARLGRGGVGRHRADRRAGRTRRSLSLGSRATARARSRHRRRRSQRRVAHEASRAVRAPRRALLRGDHANACHLSRRRPRCIVGSGLGRRGHERHARAPAQQPLAAGRKTERRGRPSPRPARLGPRGSEGRWSLRRSRWEREPSSTERATAIAKAMLERYGIVLREAPHAEGLPGGFANVYDVYRALEDQGRVRRGYFVAERGATQFALPGAEERLRTKRPDDEEPRTLVLAATDPANPWGSLLPWPRAEAPRPAAVEGEPLPTVEAAAPGRSPQRAPGARVILHDGRLLAWIGRGGQNLATFLPARRARAHARGRGARAHPRRDGAASCARSDDRHHRRRAGAGEPVREGLAPHGFLGRRGRPLVYIPPVPRAAAPEGRRGEAARAFSERGVVSFERAESASSAPPASARPSAPPPSGPPPSFDGEEWDDDDVDFDADELGADLDAIGLAGALDLDTPPDEEPVPNDDPIPGPHA